MYHILFTKDRVLFARQRERGSSIAIDKLIVNPLLSDLY